MKQSRAIGVEHLVQRLKIPSAVIVEFLRSENTSALVELINRSSLDGKRSLAPADIENADFSAASLSAIIRLKPPQKAYSI